MTISLRINGKEKEYPKGILLEELSKEYQQEYNNEIAAAIVNGKLRELHHSVEKDAEVSFVKLSESIGRRIYERTAIMVMVKAMHDLLDSLTEYAVGESEDPVRAVVDFSLGNGLYVHFSKEMDLQGIAGKLQQKMEELVAARKPITKKSWSLDDAMEIFRRQGMEDKRKLFRFRRNSAVNLYCLDGYYDYFYGAMLPNTSYLKAFKIQPYEEGLLLILPSFGDANTLKDFVPREKLFHTLDEASRWNRTFSIQTVGDLNQMICSGRMDDLILMQEAEQERRIGEIAKQIAARRGVKFILIAGPSSSGKTTFSHRLSIQLRTQGLSPHPIGLDDYFVERELTPKDADGNYDFECLEAMDIKSFNEDMLKLLAGEEVPMPSFNFKTGKREYHGSTLKLGPEDILVLEGIHGLDPKMTYALPDESKYKIYISALTTINVDGHNRIPTTDARLLRRMVRDHRTRGASAKKTFSMWPSVRRGEELYIFPFQEEADFMFNSALIYELAVLKQY
ncbi:MAG: nucleoside kinase, partial [Lachnospiraceae bacterium]|nr:nucleoside kinase [Lachnospiraceae bacterium]